MINETFAHDENGTFRAVTAGAYNIPNSYGGFARGSSFAAKGTIPLAVVREGTFKTTGKAVRGTSSQFTKIKPGDYLFDITSNTLRAVDYVVSDTLMFLLQAFPSDIGSDTTVRTCERQYFKLIVVHNTHASTDAVLCEAPFAPGEKMLNGGAPISYDTTGGGELSFDVHR